MTESQHKMPEERIHKEGDKQEALVTQEMTLPAQLGQFIRARPALHQRILLYSPLGLSRLHREVRGAGIRCTLTQLQVLIQALSKKW